MTPRELLIVMVLPGAISMLLLLVAWRPWQRAPVVASVQTDPGTVRELPPSPLAKSVLSALALASGPIAADILLRGWHGLWPNATIYFLPHIVVLGAIGGLALDRLYPRQRAHLIFMIVISLLAAYLATQHRVKTQWTAGESIAWLSGLTFASIFVWTIADGWMRTVPKPGARLPLLAWLAFSACAGVMLFSGGAALSQIAGAFAAACGPFVLLAWWRPDLPMMRPAVGVLGLALPAIMTLQFYRWPSGATAPEDAIAWDRVVLTSAWMICLVPSIIVVTGESRWWKHKRPWLRTLIAFAIGAGFAVVAVTRSIPPDKYNPLKIDASQSDYGY